jgi:hypothetical protein
MNVLPPTRGVDRARRVAVRLLVGLLLVAIGFLAGMALQQHRIEKTRAEADRAINEAVRVQQVSEAFKREQLKWERMKKGEAADAWLRMKRLNEMLTTEQDR